MAYQLRGADALFDWLTAHVDAATADRVIEWLFKLCEDPHGQPEGGHVSGTHPWRRRAIVPRTRVVLVYLVVDEHHIVEYLNAIVL
jgi:plasmid stabilization system protein ParE